jgi:hypothetical protein
MSQDSAPPIAPVASIAPAGTPKRGFRLSLDTWAVLLSFLLALLVRVGILQHVSW